MKPAKCNQMFSKPPNKQNWKTLRTAIYDNDDIADGMTTKRENAPQIDRKPLFSVDVIYDFHFLSSITWIPVQKHFLI